VNQQTVAVLAHGTQGETLIDATAWDVSDKGYLILLNDEMEVATFAPGWIGVRMLTLAPVPA
jgi:hypothetical protein